MGLAHPSGLTPHHVAKRVSQREVMTFGEIYAIFKPGDLANGEAPERFQMMWDLANRDTFELAKVVTTFR